MEVSDTRMLRWTCGMTGPDKIRKECIRRSLGVADVEGKMKDGWDGWDGMDV